MKQPIEIPTSAEIMDMISQMKCNDEHKEKIRSLYKEIELISYTVPVDGKLLKRKTGKLLMLIAKAATKKVQ